MDVFRLTTLSFCSNPLASNHLHSFSPISCSAFDSEVHRLKQQSADPATAPPDASDNIDLLNPSTMPEVSTVLQPKMFLGKLKEYQLKGVQWLVNLYEQGLNGILADEMGLGKTIQAMSFLGHLAEEKGIWGPFIVVSPASTLPNWVDELGRFCPELKVLPYWGGAPVSLLVCLILPCFGNGCLGFQSGWPRLFCVSSFLCFRVEIRPPEYDPRFPLPDRP
jgi:SNF2 family DNA or RNA helicase